MEIVHPADDCDTFNRADWLDYTDQGAWRKLRDYSGYVLPTARIGLVNGLNLQLAIGSYTRHRGCGSISDYQN